MIAIATSISINVNARRAAARRANDATGSVAFPHFILYARSLIHTSVKINVVSVTFCWPDQLSHVTVTCTSFTEVSKSTAVAIH